VGVVASTVKATIKRESDSDSKSNSKRSRGSEGHHYAGENRNKSAQATMRTAVLKRDGRCLITGSGPEHALDCAHIVGLEHIDPFTRDKHYSPLMGFALRKDLHPSYDQHEWYFKHDGSVVRLRPGTIKLPDKIEKLPDLDHLAIAEKERIAINEAAARCPYCWAKVGAANLDIHRKRSCDDPEFAAKRPKPTDLKKCEACDVEVPLGSFPQHCSSKKHLKALASLESVSS